MYQISGKRSRQNAGQKRKKKRKRRRGRKPNWSLCLQLKEGNCLVFTRWWWIRSCVSPRMSKVQIEPFFPPNLIFSIYSHIYIYIYLCVCVSFLFSLYFEWLFPLGRFPYVQTIFSIINQLLHFFSFLFPPFGQPFEILQRSTFNVQRYGRNWFNERQAAHLK